jgi:phosphopantetheinyl transferase (holo-ACP synthase)
LLDLQDFAAFTGSASKRETEKEATLYVVRKVLEMPEAKIVYTENGRPYLEDCSVSVSISHSHDKLALLFSHHSADVGVDVEKVRDKVLKIKERFLSPAELERLERSNVEVYILYWAIKEAVYKAAHIAGLIFAEQIFVEPFTFSTNGGDAIARVQTAEKNFSFTLSYLKINDYILAYTKTVE